RCPRRDGRATNGRFPPADPEWAFPFGSIRDGPPDLLPAEGCPDALPAGSERPPRKGSPIAEVRPPGYQHRSGKYLIAWPSPLSCRGPALTAAESFSDQGLQPVPIDQNFIHASKLAVVWRMCQGQM